MPDIKKMIAYSSVSHMGFVLLGLASITTEGVSGSVYQLFSHGIISTILFLIAGVLYDRTGDRMIENYRGLASTMPYFTVVVVIGFFASLGLPGFSGFIAEILVLLGAFSASIDSVLPVWMAILATLGLLLGATYYLWALQRMFFGKYWVFQPKWEERLLDLTSREYLMFVPCIIITIIMGIFPHIFLDVVGPSVGVFVNWVNTTGQFNLELLNSI
jgi:NADH-quinone oxidoreductase subunit M